MGVEDEVLRSADRIAARVFRPETLAPPWRDDEPACPDPVHPQGGYVGVRETLATLFGAEPARLVDLGCVPQGRAGQTLLALRYFIANGDVWLRHFAWQDGLAPQVGGLWASIEALRARADAPPDTAWVEDLVGAPGPLTGELLAPDALAALVTLSRHPTTRSAVRVRLRERAGWLFEHAPELLDRLYLASVELDRYPATSVSAGQLEFVLVADKGEMGVRAVREAVALGKVPVVLHSLADDRDALQVRLARQHGGFAIGLEGTFRETYAGFVQMTARIEQAFRERFGSSGWQDALARAVLYPGYGPLAENAAAIRHFRRNGIVFVGPMQDVVERAGDKREFRALAESIAPEAVTPGLVIADESAEAILSRIGDAHACGRLAFPGRIKAANGGGGRGQAIAASAEDLGPALRKVLGAIEANGWEPGVMFEQNIAETVHLEVQVMRDRFGNTRHFGMRDCTEQRASQKIQEEAPPGLLRGRTELRRWIEAAAVEIADRVGYVGAGTIELMYKSGRVFFLEMNTRIQVEHPVTEASHALRRGARLQPLNLVEWQLRLADGQPIDFAQDDVVQTHVAREFRINAEAWSASHKDSRDGKRGLFVPNAGVFDHLAVPTDEAVAAALPAELRSPGITVRFDVGFAEGDVLVNKDPTFGKLVVAVPLAAHDEPYEALRRVSLAVLQQTRIEGRQVRPDGAVVDGTEFRTNLAAHRWVLEHEVMQRHARGEEVPGRHVNWVVEALRASPSSTGEGQAR